MEENKNYRISDEEMDKISGGSAWPGFAQSVNAEDAKKRSNWIVSFCEELYKTCLVNGEISKGLLESKIKSQVYPYNIRQEEIRTAFQNMYSPYSFRYTE